MKVRFAHIPFFKNINTIMTTTSYKAHGASIDDLIAVYTKQIRYVLEFGVTVWNSSITKDESLDIERVQKAFLQIEL